MVPPVKIRTLIIVVDVHMDILEIIVGNMLIGAALILAKIMQLAAKLKTNTSVYVVQVGQAKCVMSKWSVVKMLLLEKVNV